MARLLAFDWESDELAGVEADVAAGTVRIERTFRYRWPEDAAVRDNPAALGAWLADRMKADRLSPAPARLVLSRDAIVVRRLDLPNAPDHELPDLVRFQAVAKSSMPLEKLVLDFLPLPQAEGDTTRNVLMVTIEAARLLAIRTALEAAQIEVLSTGISPVTVCELVSRIEGEHSANPHEATLVFYQDAHRVEMTTLQQRHVIFTHETRLEGKEDGQGLRASLAELNRSIVAMGQTQPGVEISEVCLIHAGDANPEFETRLAERFGGRLHVLDATRASGLQTPRREIAGDLAAFTPAVGALLSTLGPRVPAIDFVSPRRPPVKADRTRLRVGLAAAGVLALSGTGAWMLWSRISDLRAEITGLDETEAQIGRELLAGKSELAVAREIRGWVAAARDPLSIMADLRRLSPLGQRAYLKEFQMNPSPAARESAVQITGKGFAITREDIEDLQERLEKAGYRVVPTVIQPSPADAEYPYEFTLVFDVLTAPASRTPTPTRIGVAAGPS
jgi:hypothetical protein